MAAASSKTRTRQNVSKRSTKSKKFEDKDTKMMNSVYKQAHLQQIEEGIVKAPEVHNGDIVEKIAAITEDDIIETQDMTGMNSEKLEQANRDLDLLFSSNSASNEVPLIQIALQKMNETRTEIESIYEKSQTLKSKTHVERLKELDPATVKLYGELGELLATYRAGSLPRAFTALLHAEHWRDFLVHMAPERWTPAALQQVARLATSGKCPDDVAQRILNTVLLPRCRDDIAHFGKLNVYLFDALKIATTKPAPFFKGILIPLLESGDCTKLEASIFSKIVSSCKIPMLHSCACLIKICEIPIYCSSHSIFILAFIAKRYKLPYQVIDALVYHFYNQITNKSTMPIAWFEALEALSQFYGTNISAEQKTMLLDLLKRQKHVRLNPQIRRHLTQATEPENTEDVSQEDEMEMFFDNKNAQSV